MKKLTNIINEEINIFISESNNSVYTISDISRLFKELNYPDSTINVIMKLIQKQFRYGGDNNVIDFVKNLIGVNLYPVSKGKYLLNPV